MLCSLHAEFGHFLHFNLSPPKLRLHRAQFTRHARLWSWWTFHALVENIFKPFELLIFSNRKWGALVLPHVFLPAELLVRSLLWSSFPSFSRLSLSFHLSRDGSTSLMEPLTFKLHQRTLKLNIRTSICELNPSRNQLMQLVSGTHAGPPQKVNVLERLSQTLPREWAALVEDCALLLLSCASCLVQSLDLCSGFRVYVIFMQKHRKKIFKA